MTKRFESESDRQREQQAIERFIKLRPQLKFKKLGPNQIDYKILNQQGVPVSYVEVKGRNKNISNAYPLPISASKVVKLCQPRLNPIIIWSCYDGIIYGEVTKITGEFRWGGRKPREGAANDQELMVYYPKQSGLKYLRY